MTTILSPKILVDECLRLGQLRLEDDRVHVVLPPAAKWLVLALKEQREAVIAECRFRWLRPGEPWREWFAKHEGTTAKQKPQMARPSRQMAVGGAR